MLAHVSRRPPPVGDLVFVRSKRPFFVQRQLSSSLTGWWKVGFPTLWISGFGIATAALWLGVLRGRENQPPPDWVRWQFLAMWFAGSFYLVWFARRLCYVSLGDSGLTVSSFFRQATVPVTSICRVTQSYLSRPPTITLYLDRDTRLGRRIVFIPTGRNYYFSEHPITAELRAVLARTHQHDPANA